MRLVLASRNSHKLGELGALLAPHELVPLRPEVELPPEAGATFAENALAKARAAAAATGSPTLADDSGIAAAALAGAPGVRSARYAGEQASDGENLAKLLRDVPPEGDTRVEYLCALALVLPDGTERVCTGVCAGRLTHAPRGGGGFGYDPAFVPTAAGDGRTMAELTGPEKDAISHRGHAARALLGFLSQVAP